MLSQALQTVAMRCFGQALEPGALMSDHSDGCRAGMLSVWKQVPHGQCWPHIARKFGEGAFCSKKHPHFDSIKIHLEAIHLCQSAEMRDFLVLEIGKVWDSWGSKLNLQSFWNEYLVGPWDNWSVGLFDCMFCTPSQQAQESWHKQILQSRIPGMFKGSTEHVMHVALPKLVALDAALIADNLLFEVPGVPKAMLKKAKWYATRKATHLHMAKDGDTFFFYLLSASSPTWKKIDSLLVSRYSSLLNGERPKGLTRLDSFIELEKSMHFLMFEVDAEGRKAPEAALNPGGLVCSCKGFRHVGICSHCIVVNHWLGEIDVFYLDGSICPNKRTKGGFNKGYRPALEQEKPAPKKKQRLK